MADDEITKWVREEMASAAGDAHGVSQLVDACVTLNGGYGTVFGLVTPPGGFVDAALLYREGCVLLDRALDALPNGDDKEMLLEIASLRGLDLVATAGLRAASAARDAYAVDFDEALSRTDCVGDVARVRARLSKSAGVSFQCSANESPHRDDREAIVERMGLPGVLAEFLIGLPARILVSWENDEHTLGGDLEHDIESLSEMQRDFAEKVSEWNDGLPDYYAVWSESVPFLRTGQGFIALHESGAVVNLDDGLDAELNGTRLGASLASFWKSWASLAFVALDTPTIEAIRRSGFNEDSEIGQRVAAAIAAP